MEKYKNKYRTKSMRAEWWNYENNGSYFITINIEKKRHLFGHIKNGKMCLNSIGTYAYKFWDEIPQHFPSIELDTFIIMPNHMHGILIKKDFAQGLYLEQTLQCNVSTPDTIEQTLQCNVSTPDTIIPNKSKDLQMSKISPKPGSISTILRSYKSVVSKHARKLNPSFSWQTGFYDIIIRDQRAFYNFHNYINNNPKKWGKQKPNKTH